MPERKQYRSVTEMVSDLSDDAAFSRDVEERISERQVVKVLQAIRTAKGVSQAQIAEQLNCSQSRVSKIEKGFDGDLRMSELEAYAKAIDFDVHLVFGKRNSTALDRIKHHVFCIHAELCRLAELANKDEDIAKGVAQTFADVLHNQLRLLVRAAAKLPNDPETDQPYLKIDTHMDDCRERSFERESETVDQSEPQRRARSASDRTPSAVR